ncbi:DNA polymerase epsilon subunit 4 [Labeo rohita]|uniref:DNA polymerase epsilon subunit 4 n=1 Tax=Labeo rohita TaxID=84645 RepID=A0ABQ8MB78_LABRO|nr:DNA polymerase epsilon subunit 4 [Labeo rohita]
MTWSCDVCSAVRLEVVFTVRFGGRGLHDPLSPRASMAATASAAPAESELDRSGAEDEPRSAEPEEDGGNGQPGPTAGAQQHRLAKLPLSRIKALMKADPDVSLASQESVFIIAKATELFVEMIAKDALVYAQQGKRKTLQRKDLDNAIEAIDEFAFLEGKGVII